MSGWSSGLASPTPRWSRGCSWSRPAGCSSRSADTSKLSLDSDLDSYQLTTAVVTRLPALADYLTTIGVAEVSRRLPGGVSAVQEATLLAALSQAKAERDALDRGHAVAFQANPAVRRALENELRGSWDAVDASAISTTARPEGRADLAGLSAGAVYERYARAVGAVFRHDAAASSTLDTLLQARMRAPRRQAASAPVVRRGHAARWWRTCGSGSTWPSVAR